MQRDLGGYIASCLRPTTCQLHFSAVLEHWLVVCRNGLSGDLWGLKVQEDFAEHVAVFLDEFKRFFPSC